jgi:hypothetical protein
LVKDPKAWDWLCGYWASDEFRAMPERNRLNWQSKPSVHRYDAYGHVCKTQRIEKRLIISILNFCITNLFNFVLQKKHIRVDPHYFDIWEPTHQGSTDAVEWLVTVSSYSYAIFVMFILNSIFCRTDIQRS